MEVLGKEAIQEINGGGTYRVDCPFGCGAHKEAFYLPLAMSLATAKVVCEGWLRNHMIAEHYAKL